jgi:hypothetical protein
VPDRFADLVARHGLRRVAQLAGDWQHGDRLQPFERLAVLRVVGHGR